MEANDPIVAYNMQYDKKIKLRCIGRSLYPWVLIYPWGTVPAKHETFVYYKSGEHALTDLRQMLYRIHWRKDFQPMDKCFECGKVITDNEYVVNWGSCAACFGAYLEKNLIGCLPVPAGV